MDELTHGTPIDWYKDAVIYQVHVRTFLDGNGDGIGDFAGLISRLDYIQRLGVDTLWLLPFYPSPLRDDGYDIAHYQSVHPAYGTLRDVRRFLREARARRLRVITELVMNHTSDQHPWFQAARQAPPGSPARDFYVWHDSTSRYEDTRIIFSDTEASNWTWDPVARAYYWHRFYHHQPDLNYDNPRVLRAMLRVMRFWLDLGVDGFRLDAIPYLIEREGTSCESLPETHAIIRQVRRFLDTEYPGRALLAEANQWPADVSAYFGAGDECHMAFHFPLMPRLYMALQREDREPIVEILRQTPDIPDLCQWALFLRNHDELTLEMVTDEERESMWRAFAEDPRMRINAGIRRRLAPLLGGDRRRVELLTVLLLSLPGTPVVYYGDEIGMGDNIYLSDRYGVRTPMQWTGDRNAGFSTADPQRLCAPLVMDAVFGYQAVSVEAQERTPSSLLHWTRRMIAARQTRRTFGRGLVEFPETGNRRVLAFTRTLGDERVLVVANLSADVQAAQIEIATGPTESMVGPASVVGPALRARRSTNVRVPVEILGGTRLPSVADGTLPVTLAPFGWYWLDLVEASDPRARSEAADEQRRHPLPDLLVSDRWSTVLDGPVRAILERRYLLPYLQRQPWYRAPGAQVRAVRVAAHAVARDGTEPVVLVAVDVEGEVDTYRFGLTLTFTAGARGEEVLDTHPDLVLARIGGARTGVLHEVVEADAARVLMRALTEGARFTGQGGTFDAASRGPVVLADHEPYEALPTTLAQTVIACGAAAELKIRRRLLPGRSYEHTLMAALADDLDVDLPAVYAGIDLLTPDGARWPFVLLRSRVPYPEDGWQRAEALARQWIGEPRSLDAAPDPFVWLIEERDAPPLDGDPLRDLEPMMRAMGHGVARTHVAIERSTAADTATTTDAPVTSHDRDLADAALAAASGVPNSVRSRWATLLGSDAARHVLDSRQVLGALARWRWAGHAPIPIDPDDSTPGLHSGGADPGERDIAALSADLAYVALTVLPAVDDAPAPIAAARAWWAVATWSLVRGWQEGLAAEGRSAPEPAVLVARLRAGLLWRLLVDAASAGHARREQATRMLADLAARSTGASR
ncbi:MAG: maltose alpha-D-glucosyltransferase [Acidobacteria bacterium]|nr:maltose alpha-D-glucosyltransferase [Acidobacteriota bacterium]